MDILITNLSKSYGGKRIFSHFSCTIPQGSCCAVMAPSGTGKTTLLRLLLGLEKPDEGEISGVPVIKSALFQEDRLIGYLSPLENIRMTSGKQKAAEARQLLEQLGLAGCMEKPVCQLSGGEARRVSLTRALIHPGAPLALDEPFTGLDEASRLRAAEAIREYRKGRTLLLITHREEDLPLLEITQRIDLPQHP